MSLKIHLKTTVFVMLGSKHSLLVAKKRVPNTFYQNSWTQMLLTLEETVRLLGTVFSFIITRSVLYSSKMV